MDTLQTSSPLIRWKSYTTMLFLASLLIYTIISLKFIAIPD